jgi:hypothetical protein
VGSVCVQALPAPTLIKETPGISVQSLKRPALGQTAARNGQFEWCGGSGCPPHVGHRVGWGVCWLGYRERETLIPSTLWDVTTQPIITTITLLLHHYYRGQSL